MNQGSIGGTSSRAVAQIDFMLRQACPLRARGPPSGAEASLGRSLSRRLSEPFTLREPQGERSFPNVLSEVEGRAQHDRKSYMISIYHRSPPPAKDLVRRAG